MLTKSLKNALHIIGGRVGNGFQIILLDICRTETEHPVDNRLIHGGVMNTHDILPHGQQALVCTVFLRKHIPGNRLFVIDEHDVHRTVSDIADHVYAPKVRKPVCHRRKALWEHIHAYDLHMVGNISEREVHGFVLQEIVPELVPLTTDPSKRKTCRNSDFAAGHFSDIQFPCDGRKRQHIVVQIPRLIRKELLVPFTDQVELAFIDKQIFFEHRLLGIGGNACREAAVCGFDIAVAAVNSNYDYIVDHLHSTTSISARGLFRAYRGRP